MPKLDTLFKLEIRCESIPVLSVSPAPSDRATLERLLPAPQWIVYHADSVKCALTLLRQFQPAPVVVCEQDLLPGAWQDMLQRTASLRQPPSIIVASRLADDCLWVEALNLGAYDVLAKPFDVAELIRSLSLAWLHSQRQRGVSDTLPKIVTAGAT